MRRTAVLFAKPGLRLAPTFVKPLPPSVPSPSDTYERFIRKKYHNEYTETVLIRSKDGAVVGLNYWPLGTRTLYQDSPDAAN